MIVGVIEIKIPREIKNYKSKFFFNLTFRQMLCSGLAIGICVPLYVFGKKYIDEDILSWAVILIGVPLFLMGFFQLNDMTFEVFAKEWLNFNLNNQRRKYEYEPIYMELRKGYLYDDIEDEKIKRKEVLKLRKKQKRKSKKIKG